MQVIPSTHCRNTAAALKTADNQLLANLMLASKPGKAGRLVTHARFSCKRDKYRHNKDRPIEKEDQSDDADTGPQKNSERLETQEKERR
jgi:hypothetical protein